MITREHCPLGHTRRHGTFLALGGTPSGPRSPDAELVHSARIRCAWKWPLGLRKPQREDGCPVPEGGGALPWQCRGLPECPAVSLWLSLFSDVGGPPVRLGPWGPGLQRGGQGKAGADEGPLHHSSLAVQLREQRLEGPASRRLRLVAARDARGGQQEFAASTDCA